MTARICNNIHTTLFTPSNESEVNPIIVFYYDFWFRDRLILNLSSSSASDTKCISNIFSVSLDQILLYCSCIHPFNYPQQTVLSSFLNSYLVDRYVKDEKKSVNIGCLSDYVFLGIRDC